jgi:hypothetical protein
MVGQAIDKYISEFQILGHQASMDLNESMVLRLFAQGLLEKLAYTCINLDGPESFE